ncbi:hypothetical protein DH2020_029116 [Rehmannia glutinosa]|uniref:protein-serine/threonine phosphatase n=1 Tax=Rehmannia glutinosa TaxID=99300 RepID=A0ABR0VTQ9_REHGL
MGIYLSTPKTEKSSDDGENIRLRFGLSSMQGWRATMEDAVLVSNRNILLQECIGDPFSRRLLGAAYICLHMDLNCVGELNVVSLSRRIESYTSLSFQMNNENGVPLNDVVSFCRAFHEKNAAILDLDTSTSFFGVYDGHGGKVVAKFCAKYLHQQVLKHEAYLAGDIGTSVQKAFFRMDEMMRGQRGWRELAVLGDKINKFTGMIEGLIWSPRSGSAVLLKIELPDTLNVATDGPLLPLELVVFNFKEENQLVVANAGDSRCVISRNGQAYNLSRDHKPDLEVERERILKAGGFIHAGRVNGSLNLARAIGDMEFKQNKFLPAEKQVVTANPDINIVELCDEDEFIVLACDGIWDCMSSQQLVDFVREQLKSECKLSVVCEKVLDRCLAPSTAGGEGCDNMTMIIVQFKKTTSSGGTSSNDVSSSSEEVNAEESKPAESESQ